MALGRGCVEGFEGLGGSAELGWVFAMTFEGRILRRAGGNKAQYFSR